MNIPFHRPNLPDSLDEIFSNSIKSGWLTSGSKVSEFEDRLAEFLDAKYTLVVNSCTAALHLGLAANNFSKGTKFITSTFTFASTVECGIYLGLEPKLVDCAKDSYLIDLNQVEDLVKKDRFIRAIIPVHYAGETVDLDYLHYLSNKYNLFILEDAAHAFESSHNGKKIGNTNHAAAFSFYANKNLTTAGEGGAISTNDQKLAEKIKRMSLHGMTRDGWNRYQSKSNWEYDIVELGYKYNLTDLAASYGIWQLDQIKIWQKRRIEIYNRYSNGLRSIDEIRLPKFVPGNSLHLFVIRMVLDRWQITRDELIEKLKDKGIGVAVHYKPIHQLTYFKNRYEYSNECFPRSNKLFKSIISLPIYPQLTNTNVDYIIDTMCDLATNYVK